MENGASEIGNNLSVALVFFEVAIRGGLVQIIINGKKTDGK